MAANIVLLPLTTWAEQQLTALFQATDQTAFDAAFDAFVAAQPTSLVVNGEPLSRDAYKAQIWKDKFLEAGAQVRFLGVNSVPSNPQQPVTAGEVGVFLQATIDEQLLLLGAPETRSVFLSLNLVVIQDPTLKPPTGPIHGFFDGRRVSALTAVSTGDPSDAIVPPVINPGGPIQPAPSST